MKSMCLQATIVAAVATAAGALALPAAAGALKYTFGSVSGGAYCDGLTLTTTNKKTYTGEHTGCGGNLPADGHKVKGSYLDIKTAGPDDPSPLIIFLYLKQNQWELYVKVDGSLVEINSGILIKGAPANNGKSSRETNPKALLDRVF